MRLIDADAIRYDRLLKTGNKEHPLEWAVSQSAINSMPTVLPHVQHVESVGKDGSALKRGYWVHGKELSRDYVGDVCSSIHYDGWWCSECGYHFEGKPLWKYCPHCGSRNG